MSEKKKAFLETGFGAAAIESSQAAPGADGSELLSAEKVGVGEVTGAATAKRAPAQSVLPDILGKQLRTAYSELLNDPVPDRFNDLIKKLEHREAEEAQSSTSQDEGASQ
jgi:hypothetical protein